MMETVQISKMLVFDSVLLKLIIQEDFSALTHCESYKSYIVQDYRPIYVNTFDSATYLPLATVFIFTLMAQ
jgi:hypothetical protein